MIPYTDNKEQIINIDTDYMEQPQREYDLFQNRICIYENNYSGHCEVAVCIIAFNRLDKTKLCVESVLKYTQDIEYKLVLLDNGSTDQTLNYFKDIVHPNKVIYHVTKNLGAIYAGTFLMKEVKEKYMAFVANDCIVTSNWLSNMLTCMKSDRQIGMVCPVSTNISNFQEMYIGEYQNMEEMQQFAAQHNKSNPLIWEERMRLIPVLAMYKKEMLDIIGVLDPGFYHEFSDDEFSARIRRGGYKMVLCLDTFIEHNHFFEERNLEKENISTNYGFLNYQKKFGNINPITDIQNYIRQYLLNIQLDIGTEQYIKILGIDVKCGGPLLDVKNNIRKAGYLFSNIKAFTTNISYYTDLSNIAEEVIHNDIQYLKKYYTPGSFHIIVTDTPLNSYMNSLELLDTILNLLEKDGYLLISLKNNLDITKLLRIVDWERIGGIDESTNIEIQDIIHQIEKHQIENVWIFNEPFLPEEVPTLKLVTDNFVNALSGVLGETAADIKEKLLIKKYWLLIKK